MCVIESFQFLMEIARQKNNNPLPAIKPHNGPRLPPDRYCLSASNYRLRPLNKRVNNLRFGLKITVEGFVLSPYLVHLTLLLIDHLKPFKISTFKNAHWFCTHMVIPFEQCW